MKIYAPVEDCFGIWATVQFIDGVGETDDPNLIKWFKEHGYYIPALNDEQPKKVVEQPTQVEQVEPVEEVVLMGGADEPDEPNEPDFDNMTIDELRGYIISLGLTKELRNIRNRTKLLKIIENNKHKINEN